MMFCFKPKPARANGSCRFRLKVEEEVFEDRQKRRLPQEIDEDLGKKYKKK
jgi:hypothetical protein